MSKLAPKHGWRRLVSFVLTVALTLTLLPAAVAFAQGTVTHDNTAARGGLLAVTVSGFTGDFEVIVSDGTARFSSGHYTVLYEENVEVRNGPGRVPTSQIAAISGNTTFFISISPSAPISSTFYLGGTEVTIIDAPIGPDLTPRLAVNAASRTLDPVGGWVPEAGASLTYAFAFGGENFSDVFVPGTTVFPSQSTVTVTQVVGGDSGFAQFTFAVQPAAVSAVSAPDWTFVPMGGGVFNAAITVPDISMPGLPSLALDVTEFGVTHTLPSTVIGWTQQSAPGIVPAIWETNIAGFPGVTLRATVSQQIVDPVLTLESVSGASFVSTTPHFTDQPIPGAPAFNQVWRIVGGDRVYELDLTGLDYTVNFVGGATRTRAQVTALDSGFTETITFHNQAVIQISLTQTNGPTVTATATLPVPIQRNIVESVELAQTTSFFDGQQVGTINPSHFNITAVMSDGTRHPVSAGGSYYSFSLGSHGVFAQIIDTDPLPANTSLGTTLVYFGVPVTLGALAPVWGHIGISSTTQPTINAIGTLSVANTPFGIPPNIVYTGAELIINVIDDPDAILSWSDLAGASITLASTPSGSDVILSWNTGQNAFIGSIPANFEGILELPAAGNLSGFSVHTEAVRAQFFNNLGSSFRVDRRAPSLAQPVITAQTISINVTEANLRPVTDPQLFTATPEFPAGTSVIAVPVADGITTLIWSPPSNWSGSIAIRDLVGQTAQTGMINFIFGNPPNITGVTVTPATWSMTKNAQIAVGNPGEFASFDVHHRVFPQNQLPTASEIEAWTPAGLAADNAWASGTNLNIVGINQIGSLYVMVVGNLNIGGQTHSVYGPVAVSNVVTDSVVFRDLETTTTPNQGTFTFAVDAHTPSVNNGGPANVRIHSLQWVAVSEQDYDDHISGLTTGGQVESWVNDHATYNWTAIDIGAEPNRTTLARSVNTTMNDSRIVVLAVSHYMGGGGEGERLGDAFAVSGPITGIVTVTYTLDNGAISGLNGEWANAGDVAVGESLPIIVDIASANGVTDLLWRAVPVGDDKPAVPGVGVTDGWNVAAVTANSSTINFNQQGAFDIYVIARTGAGVPLGIPYLIATARLDNIAPTNLVADPANQPAFNQVVFRFAAVDATSGVAEFRISEDDDADWLVGSFNPAFIFGAVGGAGITAQHFETFVTDIASGTWYIVAIDEAGNVSVPVEFVIPETPTMDIRNLVFERGSVPVSSNNVTVGNQDLTFTMDTVRSTGAFFGPDPLPMIEVALFEGADPMQDPQIFLIFNEGSMPPVNYAAAVGGLTPPEIGRSATFTFNFGNLGLSEGVYTLIITPVDSMGLRTDTNAEIFTLAYSQATISVETLRFTSVRRGEPLPSPLVMPFGNEHPADMWVTVREGDDINVDVLFTEPTTGTPMITVGGVDVTLTVVDNSQGRRFTGTLPVTLEGTDAVNTVLAGNNAEWMAFVNTAASPYRQVEEFDAAQGFWLDMLAEVDGIGAFAVTGYGYIMYDLSATDAAGNTVRAAGLTGLSTSGMEADLLGDTNVSVTVTDGRDLFWWTGEFGVGLRDQFAANQFIEFRFVTTAPVTPFELDGSSHYGVNAAVWTDVFFTAETAGSDYVFEVDFAIPGGATLRSEEINPTRFENVLRIPLTAFFGGFAGFDWDENADFTLHMILETVSGVRQYVNSDTDVTLNVSNFRFIHVPAGLDVFDGNIELEFDAQKRTIFNIPTVGSRTLTIENTSGIIGIRPGARTELWHRTVDSATLDGILSAGTLPSVEAGWFRSLDSEINLPVSAAVSADYLVIVSRSWTGAFDFYVVELNSVASAITVGANNIVTGVVSEPTASIVFISQNAAIDVYTTVHRSAELGAFEELTIGTDMMIRQGTTVVGQISVNAAEMTVQIWASGIYRITASNGLGGSATVVFER